jgi:hypothetical protein
MAGARQGMPRRVVPVQRGTEVVVRMMRRRHLRTQRKIRDGLSVVAISVSDSSSGFSSAWCRRAVNSDGIETKVPVDRDGTSSLPVKTDLPSQCSASFSALLTLLICDEPSWLLLWYTGRTITIERFFEIVWTIGRVGLVLFLTAVTKAAPFGHGSETPHRGTVTNGSGLNDLLLHSTKEAHARDGAQHDDKGRPAQPADDGRIDAIAHHLGVAGQQDNQ